MNIIFFSAKRRKVLNLYFGPLACAGLAVVLGLAGTVAFKLGYKQASMQTQHIVQSIRTQTKPLWQAEVKQELDDVRQARARAEKSLNAMAGRLSLLQGHVMRLDALGSRLAARGNLQDIVFDTEAPPGMGGPVPSVTLPQQAPGFIESLAQLEIALEDRQDKLLAMESMLIDRKLQERTLPAGVPAKSGWFSSSYGYRADPFTGNREFHEGIDYAGKLGTDIVAVAAGIVTWSGRRHGYGRLIEINHGNGLLTRYAHNAENLVAVGDKIDKGEVIALMGSSGRSTGSHVHFEVLKDGKHINPKKYLSHR
ncbi:MAG: M23 family metallopeptidase [Gammaproteobacteria bacterium]